MQKCRFCLAIILVVAWILLSGCVSTGNPPVSTPSTGVSSSPAKDTISPASESLTLNAASLAPGSALPEAYTCKGAGGSPPVSWEGIPPGTKSLVLIMDDPDAPAGTFTHWLVYNIPPQNGGLDAGQPNAKVLADGSQQGETSGGSRGYYPACPPGGTTHHYVFRLYAVDMEIAQPTASRESIDWVLSTHTLARAEVSTIFRR